MPTEVRENEERSHSARYLILIFLICVIVCAVFFSMGFLVGFNERGSHSAPPTEVINTPAAIPPTVNPPPDSGQAAPPATSHAPASAEPENEVIPPGGGITPAPPGTKPQATPSPNEHPQTQTKPAANPAPTATPAPGEVGEGITLQVAALRTKQDAEALVNILKGRGYPVFMVSPEYAHADDNLFRVQVGPFKTRDDADKVRDKLTQEGFKPFVRH